MKNFPKISLVVPTLNNAKILPGFLELISKQKFPEEKIEIIIADGGSKDETIKIAKKFSTKIFNNEKVLAEPGVTLGMEKATGEIFIILATDNYLHDVNSLQKYADTFENDEVYAAFPKQDSKPWDSVYSKYINTFTDPFNHFVYGYCANGRTFKKVFKTLESNKIFDLYDFTSSPEVPLIAFAQGFAIRSGYNREKKNSMDDIKPVMDIIHENKQIAFIHSLPLYHHTIKDLGHFIRKQRWATRNVLENKKYGISYRSSQLSPNQKFRMKIWPFYALSFFFPFLYSIFHLLKDREIIWIYHAPLCFISAGSSFYEVLVYNMFKREIVSRQA